MTDSRDKAPRRESIDRQTFDGLMDRAREGDQQAIGKLVDQCRNYLLLIANDELVKDVQGKVGPSDIVQESMLAAQIDFQHFRGSSPEELRAWLKGILKNGLHDAARRFKTIQKRQVTREQKLYDTKGTPQDVSDKFYTPGTQAAKKEEAELLKQTMQRLSEDHQQVLQLRNWEQLSFEEIGVRMNRSTDAARKLWYRALVELQNLYARSSEQPITENEP